MDRRHVGVALILSMGRTDLEGSRATTSQVVGGEKT